MHLKSALSNIRRSPFQAVAAIMVFTVTFFVASIICLLVYSSSQVLKYFETRPQVIAFIKTDAKDADVNTLKAKLENDIRVKEVKLVSKEDAFNIYKNATSDNPLLGQLVSPSIFPSSVEFSVKDLANASKIIGEVKKESIVDSVSFTASLGNETTLNDVIGRLTKITSYIRIGGLTLALVLGFTSLIVLMVVISMRISAKGSEIETLKLMGATNGFIKTPIMLEAIIYVSLGVILGWILAFILSLYVTPAIISYFAAVPVLPKDTTAFLMLNLTILGGEIIVGLIIAMFGGFFAVSRAVSK